MKPRIFLLKNDRHEVAGLSKWVDQISSEIGLIATVRGELQVALEEVALNVITHGYGEGGVVKEFSISLEADSDFITAVVEDEAPAFDPTGRAEADLSLPPDHRPIGGLGIHLVKNLVESMHHERRGARNVLTLRFRRDGSRGASTAGSA
jgi:anti-sigma regulatory factor (Ser/Thr protein kinase)